jgi:hypothetical protein
MGQTPNSPVLSGDDVFLAPSPLSAGMLSQLSPTADVFTPGYPDTPHARTPLAHVANGRLHDNVNGPGRRSSTELVVNSVPEVNRATHNTHLRPINTAGVIGQPFVVAGPTDAYNHLKNMNLSIIQFRDVSYTQGTFSTDEGATRAFAVHNIPKFGVPMIHRILSVSLFSPSTLSSLIQIDWWHSYQRH